ncbi:MAG: methyltransferase domain-containing protein [Nanoarchaeota archaeon]|nr:methyltransferase domain-containing protein [Nanoarchaeota archaeon]
MNYRGFESLKDVIELFIQLIVPSIGQTHLDFGCGNGLGTLIQTRLCPDSLIIGYDLEKSNIDYAKKRLNYLNNLRHNINTFGKSLGWEINCKQYSVEFTDLEKRVKELFPFCSATANFVFHENPATLRYIYDFLNKNGKICILDYNMKGISRRDFCKRFSLDNERRTIQKEGFETAYKKHTSLNLDDCAQTGVNAGFKTDVAKDLGKYFVWIGKKQAI